MVNVSCGVVAPAVEAIPNTAALHARVARMTPDKTLRFMGLVPSGSMVIGRKDGLIRSDDEPSRGRRFPRPGGCGDSRPAVIDAQRGAAVGRRRPWFMARPRPATTA